FLLEFLNSLDHLEAAGHVCFLKDSFSCESSLVVSKLISSENFDAALAIHLYKAGRLLQGSRIPFGVIFGGTDINEDTKCEEKVRNSSFRIFSLTPVVAAGNSCHQSGIVTTPNVSFNWEKCLQSAGIPHDGNSLCYFLLICGLRRVKDPLYLADAFAEWHREDPSVQLIIIGPAVSFFPSFISRADGVHLLKEIPQEDLHAAVKKCFAVVNSSISEGMSAALLEAMDLNVPVLARNIPGNAAIITHQETGLLYSNPEEFVQLSKSLISDPCLQRKIVARAKEYVTKHHSWEHERNAYQNFVLSLH
uniref:Glycosyl transferase family 1 domain-containing protein n=1 Tax=Anolis carolinensis TaxID=28377 RepID=H9GTY8_ANOCA